VRPNLIALSVCKIVSVTGNVVTVEGLDAFDATPILDLKPFIPSETKDLRTPEWLKK
jgi:formylmethanofuran dehydrogenase subunit E